jgi:membrane associated rhomboid family serine protease
MTETPPSSSQTPSDTAGDPPRRPRPFEGVPKVVLWLVGIIAAAHVARILLPEAWQEELFVRFALVPSFQTTGNTPYVSVFDRLAPFVGHMFLHGGFIHLAFNSIAILQLGDPVARMYGAWRFLFVFFVTGIVGGLTFILINPHLETPAIGASGAACGLFGAYAGEALIRARGAWGRMRRGMIWRGVFWFLAINVGLAAAANLTHLVLIAWEAHLGGFLAGLALAPFIRRRAV